MSDGFFGFGGNQVGDNLDPVALNRKMVVLERGDRIDIPGRESEYQKQIEFNRVVNRQHHLIPVGQPEVFASVKDHSVRIDDRTFGIQQNTEQHEE